MAAPYVWDALNDESVKKQFDQWGQKLDNHAGDYVEFLSLLQEFKNQPIMAAAASIQRTYTGLPERGNESVTNMPLPSDVRDQLVERIREGLPRDEEGNFQEIRESDLGAIPVRVDAFDGAEAYARTQIEQLWNQFWEENEAFEAQAMDPAAGYDPSDVNQRTLKDAADDDMIHYVQKGALLLIGEDHPNEILQYVRENATSLGNVQITKGAFLSAGGLKVWGCVAADRDAFEEEIEKFSKKKVSFV